MDNISHRAVIRYLNLKSLTPKEIDEDMVVTLGENAPLQSMAMKWDAKFRRGRDSLEDDPRQRTPVIVTTQETIATIRDRRVTEYYSATELGISQDCIHEVFNNEHNMSKVSARVPKSLDLI